MKRIWIKWYKKIMFSFISRRYCSSIESFQCMEKKQDGNALRAVNIAKASEETGNRFTRRYHHSQDTRYALSYALSYASNNQFFQLFDKFALRLRPRLCLRQAMLGATPPAKFSKIANFQKIFKKLAQGYALGYALGKFQKNFTPQAMPQAAMLGATPPAKFS
ncbi:hypothetical protein T05_5912 [Trichinella murrelli]|uniref:Uncharacterized protein n=1 Tax=Trichinella murrelli TaxID=144512 RepID=A0A0V0T5P5_9BILA|nr:hypothetical protein T05_5912 [Trichinella murrelli]